MREPGHEAGVHAAVVVEVPDRACRKEREHLIYRRYLEPDEARTLIGFLAARFPGATLVFDSIPHWFSRKTLSGLTLANGYQTPPMPYALTYGEAEKLVEIDGVAEVGDIALPPGRGVWKSSILRRIGDLPLVRDVRPHLLRLRFAD